MKVSRELAEGLYTIHACREDAVVINLPRSADGANRDGRLTVHESFIISPRELLKGWGPTRFEAMTDEAMSALSGLDAEVLLLGTGRQMHFPAGEQLAALVGLGIGYEVMDSAAACRTYNVLAGEGRRVAAAIILEKRP